MTSFAVSLAACTVLLMAGMNHAHAMHSPILTLAIPRMSLCPAAVPPKAHIALRQPCLQLLPLLRSGTSTGHIFDHGEQSKIGDPPIRGQGPNPIRPPAAGQNKHTLLHPSDN